VLCFVAVHTSLATVDALLFCDDLIQASASIAFETGFLAIVVEVHVLLFMIFPLLKNASLASLLLIPFFFSIMLLFLWFIMLLSCIFRGPCAVGTDAFADVAYQSF
jgi:hypothetical protein